MQSLPLRKHRDVLFDPPGARLRSPRIVDPVEKAVPLRTAERLEERFRGRAALERSPEVLRDGRAALRRIRRFPASIGFRGLYRRQPGRSQPPLLEEPLGLLSVDLRPAAPRPARREPL